MTTPPPRTLATLPQEPICKNPICKNQPARIKPPVDRGPAFWIAARLVRMSGAGEELAGAVGVGRVDEEGHLACVADAERMHGLDELAAHNRGDAVAVEQRADHERLGLIAAAAHLDQRGRGLRRRLPLRKLDDLAPASHRCDLYHS